jgi:hypothetical protein
VQTQLRLSFELIGQSRDARLAEVALGESDSNSLLPSNDRQKLTDEGGAVPHHIGFT